MSLIENLIASVNTKSLASEKRLLFDSFLQKGFPTTKDEEWKYTSLKKIIASNYSLYSKEHSCEESSIQSCSLGLSDKIVFCNGKLHSYPRISGVKITGFSDFNCRNNDSIVELNAALANSGCKIIIDKNFVNKNLGELAKDTDLSKFIL